MTCMKCPKCGLESHASALRCDCGYDFQSGQVEKSSLTIDQQRVGPVGVGGWLLVFCLTLTVFSPLMTIVNLHSAYQEFNPLFRQFPGLLIVTVLDFMLSMGLMCFSISAGVALWQMKPSAVRTTKRYLMTFLLCTVIASILPFMAGLPSQVNEAMISEVIKNGFRVLVFFMVWYTYLNKSRRVKNTFSVS
jgi:Protein of unknown function (DUF2569)